MPADHPALDQRQTGDVRGDGERHRDQSAEVGHEALDPGVPDVVLDHVVDRARRRHPSRRAARRLPAAPGSGPTPRSPGPAPRARTTAVRSGASSLILRRELLAHRPGCLARHAHAANPTDVPVEPPASPWVFPDPRPAFRGRPGRRRRRTWSRARCSRRTAPGMFPMPVGDAPRCLVVAVDRGVLPLDGLVVVASLRRSLRGLRGPGRHCLRRGGGRGAPTRRARQGWITRDIVDGVRRACTSWAGRTRSRPGRTASSVVACTAWRSAASSPASRCSTGSRRLEGRAGRPGRACCRRACAGRLLDVQWVTPAPGHPRRRRDPAGGVPRAARAPRCRCPARRRTARVGHGLRDHGDRDVRSPRRGG